MKNKLLRLLFVCFLIPCLFLLPACSKNNEPEDKFSEFIDLKAGQTLNIGNSTKFKNYKTEQIEEYYITYPALAIVTLNRTSSYSSNYVYYDNYYYYWTIEETNENLLLGNKIITTSYLYSYLVYGSDYSSIVVRTTTTTETNYDFELRDFTKKCDIEYDFNGYFSSLKDVKEQVPDLAGKLSLNTSNRFYIPNIKTTYSYSKNTYNDTYFYFD